MLKTTFWIGEWSFFRAPSGLVVAWFLLIVALASGRSAAARAAVRRRAPGGRPRPRGVRGRLPDRAPPILGTMGRRSRLVRVGMDAVARGRLERRLRRLEARPARVLLVATAVFVAVCNVLYFRIALDSLRIAAGGYLASKMKESAVSWLRFGRAATLAAVAALLAVLSNALAGPQRRLPWMGDYPNARIVPSPAPGPAAPPANAAAASSTAAPALANASAGEKRTYPPHPDKPLGRDRRRRRRGAPRPRGRPFLDARRTSVYADGHIPERAAVPDLGVRPSTTRSRRLFDEGTSRQRSDRRLLQRRRLRGLAHARPEAATGVGFNNALVYKDGFPDWEKRGLPVDEGGGAVIAASREPWWLRRGSSIRVQLALGAIFVAAAVPKIARSPVVRPHDLQLPPAAGRARSTPLALWLPVGRAPRRPRAHPRRLATDRRGADRAVLLLVFIAAIVVQPRARPPGRLRLLRRPTPQDKTAGGAPRRHALDDPAGRRAPGPRGAGPRGDPEERRAPLRPRSRGLAAGFFAALLIGAGLWVAYRAGRRAGPERSSSAPVVLAMRTIAQLATVEVQVSDVVRYEEVKHDSSSSISPRARRCAFAAGCSAASTSRARSFRCRADAGAAGPCASGFRGRGSSRSTRASSGSTRRAAGSTRSRRRTAIAGCSGRAAARSGARPRTGHRGEGAEHARGAPHLGAPRASGGRPRSV